MCLTVDIIYRLLNLLLSNSVECCAYFNEVPTHNGKIKILCDISDVRNGCTINDHDCMISCYVIDVHFFHP